MDEENKSLSFLDLLEHMKNYLRAAGETSKEIEDRQKSLTEQPVKDDKKPEGEEER